MTVNGKRVLMTGASGGLGTATMAALMENGCEVVGIDKVASAQFKDNTIVADLMDEAQTEDAVAAAIERQTDTSEPGGTSRRRGTRYGSRLFRASGAGSVPDVPRDAFTPCGPPCAGR
jgi:NAD(P)-dependent dehydrogenase (short-subunit alcohol dehydrogenase family)